MKIQILILILFVAVVGSVRAQAPALDAALKKAGVYSDLHVIKHGAHGFVDPRKYDPAAYDATIHFLKKYLAAR